MTEIVWFRKDLRLADNPAWSAATNSGDDVVPLFVIDPRLWDRASAPRVRLLAAHLRALDAEIAEAGGRLMVHTGVPEESIPTIVERCMSGVNISPRESCPRSINCAWIRLM